MRCGARYAGRQAGGGGERPRCKQRVGQGGKERTRNMRSMFMTLEVSKLSGWLNADALCRGSKGGHRYGGIRYGAWYADRQAGEAAGGGGARSV